MNESRAQDSERREFLKHGIAAALALGILEFDHDVAPTAILQRDDAPSLHNMLVVGEQAVFLSHLPMFHGLDKTRGKFISPHRYQVILEVTFTRGEKEVTALYVKDRHDHPSVQTYTLAPEQFVLSRLFSADPQKPRLTSFRATVFRGHLERGGEPVPGLDRVLVRVARVVHAREFDPATLKPAQLEYIVFGKRSELLLAHAIFSPPDFDHVLAVTLVGRQLEPTLPQGLRIVFPGRKNTAAERLRELQQFAGTLRRGGDTSSSGTPVKVKVDRELYFEEGELLVPPSFDPTPEERKREP